jgi:hypothetical protein
MSILTVSQGVEAGLINDIPSADEPLPDAPLEKNNSFNSDGFSAAFESAWKHFDGDEKVEKLAKSSRKTMDELISEGIDREEEKQSDREAFSRSGDVSREILDRYQRIPGATVAGVLDNSIAWIERFLNRVPGTADHFAQCYLTSSPYALRDRPEKKSEAKDEKAGRWHRLDDVISKSIDRASTDRADFEATKSQRARLKKIWPDLTYDQQLARINQIDKDAHADPITTAARLAAWGGEPITGGQHYAQAELHQAQQLVHRHTQTYSMTDAQRLRAAELLSSPRFQSSGSPERDLAWAHGIAAAEEQQMALASRTVEQYTATVHMSPQDRKLVSDILREPQWARIEQAYGLHDDYSRLHFAHELAKKVVRPHLARNAGNVGRARRAQTVRSSTGTGVGSSGSTKRSGLDRHLSAAMDRYQWD